MRVRVCDDVADVAEEWVSLIQTAVPAEFDVARMENAKDEISNLLQRKLAVEEQKTPLDVGTEFDNVDILIVDYDLVHLDESGSRNTGEGVARLARSFSNCGAIVVMNQFKGPNFDLGMRGHLDSFADKNVDAALIGHAALWKQLELGNKQFNPTTWTPIPILLRAARELSMRFAAEGVDAAIMPQVGLEPAALSELSDTAYGFLSLKAQTAEELAKVSVREFLERSRTDGAVGVLLETAPEILFNFAAFRIVKWLDRAVLRPMDVLIDTLHLIDRLPFLIDSGKLDPAEAVNWAKAAAAPQEGLRWDILEEYYNKNASAAVGKIVLDWYRIANEDRIDAMQDAYLDEQPARFYLAEDTSRFVQKEALTRYRADFHNFGDRRAIEQLDGISYGPMRRIHFG